MAVAYFSTIRPGTRVVISGVALRSDALDQTGGRHMLSLSGEQYLFQVRRIYGKSDAPQVAQGLSSSGSITLLSRVSISLVNPFHNASALVQAWYPTIFPIARP